MIVIQEGLVTANLGNLEFEKVRIFFVRQSNHNNPVKRLKNWVKERALKVLDGGASQVAAGIRGGSTKRDLNSKERKNADKCSE